MNKFVTWCVTMSVARRVITGLCVVGLPLTILLLLVASMRFVEPPITVDSAAEVARLCDALQDELDHAWLHRHAGVLGPRTRTYRRAEEQVPTPPLAAELKRQLGRLPNPAQSSQTTVIRQLAEATLATAEHRYQAALRTIRDLEQNPSARAADIAFTRQLHSLRGDALFGLGKWEAARVCYEKLGGDVFLCAKVCVCLTQLVERKGQHELSNELAGALDQVGLQLNAEGWASDAIIVYKKAIALRTALAEEDPHPELSVQLAGTLNNCGVALWNVGQVEHAVVQFDRAIGLQRQLVEDDEDSAFAQFLADTLSNRGCMFLDVGESSRALADLDQSVTILRELVEQEGDPQHTSLVSALSNRALTLHTRGQHVAAFEDLEMAIALLTPAASRGERQDAMREIAPLLINRAIISTKIGNPRKAVEDLDRAIALLSDPVDATAQPRLVRLGICYAKRGAAWQDLGELRSALTDLHKAVSLFDQFSRQSQNWAVSNQLANVFNMLAAIHSLDDRNFHDAAKAVDYASHACQLTNWSDPEFLSTLDVAYDLQVPNAPD